MNERKGFFSRLFGRKGDRPAADDAPPPDDALFDPAPDDAETIVAPAEATEPPRAEPTPDIVSAPEPEVWAEFAAPRAPTEPAAPVAVPSPAPGDVALVAPPAPIIPSAPVTPPAPAMDTATVGAAIPDPTPAPLAPDTAEVKPAKKKGLFARLASGLARTSSKLVGGIGAIFTRRKLDAATLGELEDLLITADLGVPTTGRIIQALRTSRYDQEISDEEVRAVLASEIEKTLAPLERPLDVRRGFRPHIILVAGVNGAGKTTTIGKLARKFQDDGLSVMLAAGDTFRAAAIEQLQIWGTRTGVPVIARAPGADAAGLAFDAVKAAQADGIDVLLIDTAGRLQNRTELMDELGKMVRVLRKLDPAAPHDALLVLDATVGQNALSQAEAFLATASITGLIMTKLDGTARGGVLVALGDRFALPIHFIGVGEAVEDLQPFNAASFARALTSGDA